MKNYIKKNLKTIKWLIVYIYSHLIKKEKNIWVFGAIQGEKYLDNAKYLYEYINQSADVKAIWLSNNANIIEHLRSRGYLAANMHSREGIGYALRAKVAVITHRGCNRNADLPFYAFTKDTKIIQLWHGVPLKKIAYDDNLFSFKNNKTSPLHEKRKLIKRILHPYNRHLHRPDMVIALSNETKKLFSRAFRVPEDTVSITGYPRNDVFFEGACHNNIEETTNKIIYMPTFRGEIGASYDLLSNYGFNVNAIDSFLENISANLYIKLHPFNKPTATMLNQITKSTNIKFLNCDDIYELLPSFSMLITDYSSIYFDFLLTDKPIIFAPFDREIYLKTDRELYYDYDEVTPGPKACNWEEILELIKTFLSNPEFYSNDRKIIKKRFHKYLDGNSSMRTFDAIQKLIS